MADFIPVANQLQQYNTTPPPAPSMLDNYSKILGIKNQQIQNVSAQQQLQQQNIQIARERAALQQNLANLDMTHRRNLGAMLGSFINSDRSNEDIVSSLEDYGLDHPESMGVVHFAEDMLHRNSDGGKNKDKRNAFLKQARDAVLGTEAQAGQQSPQMGTRQAPGGLQAYNLNPQAPGGVGDQGQPMSQGLSPQEQYGLERDQFGNIISTQRAPTGPYTGAKALSGTPQLAAGEKEALINQANQNFANVSSNRTAASSAPQQLDQINKALDLSKSVETGGSWTGKRAEIESNISSLIPGFSSAQSDAAKVQLLDKFTERIASDASKVLGSNASTDEARASIHRQNANIGYTPKAVQSILEYAKSQTMAMQAKGNAQDKWFAEGGQLSNQHQFESAWRQAYDPVIFQLKAASSKEERDKIMSKLSPQEKKELPAKYKSLQALGAM